LAVNNSWRDINYSQLPSGSVNRSQLRQQAGAAAQRIALLKREADLIQKLAHGIHPRHHDEDDDVVDEDEDGLYDVDHTDGI
jgi:hypothetical protein